MTKGELIQVSKLKRSYYIKFAINVCKCTVSSEVRKFIIPAGYKTKEIKRDLVHPPQCHKFTSENYSKKNSSMTFSPLSSLEDPLQLGVL